jgi:hypothetical protein
MTGSIIMETTRRPSSWRARAITAAAVLSAITLAGAATGCQSPTGAEATPTSESAAPARRAGAGPMASRLGVAPAHHLTLQASPDLLADLESRVGPQTAARLTGARDAGRAFAQRLGGEGVEAQGIADVFTQLAFDVARAERDTAAGSDERTATVTRAAQDALDGLRRLIPEASLPEAQRELMRWTGDVAVTWSQPSRIATPATEAALP